MFFTSKGVRQVLRYFYNQRTKFLALLNAPKAILNILTKLYLKPLLFSDVPKDDNYGYEDDFVNSR